MKKHIYVPITVAIPESLKGHGNTITDNSEELIKKSKYLTLEEKKELLDANARRKSAEWGYIRERLKELCDKRVNELKCLSYRERNYYKLDEELIDAFMLLVQYRYSFKAIQDVTKGVAVTGTLQKWAERLELKADIPYTRYVIVELIEDFSTINLQDWQRKGYNSFAGGKPKQVYTNIEHILFEQYEKGVDSFTLCDELGIGRNTVDKWFKIFDNREIRKGLDYYAKE